MFVLIASSPCMHALASQCLFCSTLYVVPVPSIVYSLSLKFLPFSTFLSSCIKFAIQQYTVIPTIAQPSLQIVFCTLQVFIAPQCGQFSLKLEKVLDFSSCSVSIRTAVILNSLPQFLQLAITTILTDYKLCSLNSLKLLLVIITISLI